MEAAAAHIMDLSQPFDAKLLDELVSIAMDGSNIHRAAANDFLVRMKDHPEMWKRVDKIIEACKYMPTKFFGLQVLGEAVNTRWKIIPLEQREGVRNFVVAKIVNICVSEEMMRSENTLLSRLNLVLVQILKQDWPDDYPMFIDDIVASSKSSELICENNMQILKLLSEEVFDFSRENMTLAKVKHMKVSLNLHFAQIFQLCEYILSVSKKTSLLLATLQTLQRFLSWIPLGYVFETPLVNVLISKFFPEEAFRTSTLDCLIEIAGLSPADISDQYRPTLQQLICSLIQQLNLIIPNDMNLITAYESGNHLKIIEKNIQPEHEIAVKTALMLIVRVSEVNDEEIFKTCLDFWQIFCKDLYNTTAQFRAAAGANSSNFLFGRLQMNNTVSQYDDILHRLRHVMIDRMAKPEEVLIVEDENGEIVREMAKDTEVIAQYKTMREAIVYLTHLNYEDTEAIMLEKLDAQVGRRKFTWQGLNTLCWAIGSISGAMSELDEKRFLVTVIKDLLRLCEEQRGKDNKAVVASNIMYIVGQYPRFLRAHWKFLKTVVNKLFEFMHEHHPGVQDMACDTFFKIAQKCKRKFMTLQVEEDKPFIYTLIADLQQHISELQPHQIQAFYEAAACMISDHGPAITIAREDVLTKLMGMPNQTWQLIMNDAAQSVDSLYQVTTSRELSKILRTNTRVCAAAGPIFIHQLSAIFLDMLNIYRLYSEQITQACVVQGEIATRLTQYKAMRGVKSDILDLMTSFLEQQLIPDETDKNPRAVMQSFMPPLMQEVLSDYHTTPASAKDPRVLTLFSTATSALRQLITPEIPRIMDAIFEPTLDLITKNMMDYPEHRIGFFKFLRSANEHSFFGLFSISPPHQKLVIDSIVWAFKHTERNISETGLDILHELLQNVQQSPQFAQAFYQAFLLPLIQDILGILTDRLHKSGFRMQATVLKHIFSLVQSGEVNVPLFEASISATSPLPQIQQMNQQMLKEHVANLVMTAFPNLTKSQVVQFVLGLFDVSMDLNAFKQHLRDFLVTVKEFQSEDNSELFSEEAEATREMQRMQEMQYRASVPGLLAPVERDIFSENNMDPDDL
eukprot:gene9489-19720_t